MTGYLLIDETAEFVSREAHDRLVGDGLTDAPAVHGLRRRWRRFLYLRLCFYDEAGAPCGGTMLRAERIDTHVAWLGYPFCLDEETLAPDMPRNYQVYGGGRRDCCDNQERLAPEALAFCRAIARGIPIWLRLPEWKAPGYTPWPRGMLAS